MTINSASGQGSSGGGSGGITQLTGDVTAGPGSGSQAAQVTGAHFGGVSGEYWINRSGVWVPSTPQYSDLSGTPSSLPPSGAAGGDLGGSYPSPTVVTGSHITSEVTGTDFEPSGLTGATAASRYVGATASGAPAGGTFAVGDWCVDQTGNQYVCTVAGSPGTWVQTPPSYAYSKLTGAPSSLPPSGAAGGDLGSNYPNPTVLGLTHLTNGASPVELSAPDHKSTGLSPLSAGRYVGYNSGTGAPGSGTFVAGDFCYDSTGTLFVCTAGGTPGTWVSPSGGGGAMVKIQTQSPSSAASVTFSSIPQTYLHLMILGTLVLSSGGNLNASLNGASATPGSVQGQGSGTPSAQTTFTKIAGGGAATVAVTLVVPDYTGTSNRQEMVGLVGGESIGPATVVNASSLGIAAGAITTVTLAPASGTVTGLVTLYGLS